MAIAPINNKFLLSSASAKAGDTDNDIIIKLTSQLLILDLSMTINRSYIEDVLRKVLILVLIRCIHYIFANNNFLTGAGCAF